MNSTLRKVLIGAAATVFVCSWIGMGYTIYQELQAIDHYEQSMLLLNLPDYEAIQKAVESNKAAEGTTTKLTETTHPTEDVIVFDPAIFDDTQSVETLPDVEPVEGIPDVEIIDAYAKELSTVDISVLKEQNEDVVGWIIIPETNISYPITQGDDNEYYLKHTWDKVSNSSGSIYLDYRSSAEIDDFNNIIYGHKMRSGMMFSDLTKYSEQSFYDEHPSIYIITETAVRRYDIFSSYEADVKNGHSYRLGLKTEEGRSSYIEYCLEASKIETDVVPTTDGSIVTLSTCTQTGIYSYTTRWVVHASLAYETAIE